MAMERSLRKRVADLAKALQPSMEAEERHYEQLPVGTRVWIPCAGKSSRGIQTGHVGRVDTYAGNRKYVKGGWISRQQAEQDTELILSRSSGLCAEQKEKSRAQKIAEARRQPRRSVAIPI